MKSPDFPDSRYRGSSCILALAFAFLISSLSVAKGVIAIGLQHFGYPHVAEDLPPISNSDLVNTGSPDLMFYNSTFIDEDQYSHDGTPAAVAIIEDHGHFTGMTTFYLNTVTNPLGYTIDAFSIFTFGFNDNELPHLGYVGSLADHHYKIEYSAVGSDDFTTLTTIDIAFATAGTHRVTLAELGLEEVAVDVIRLSWFDPLPTSDSLVILAEIDIFGAAVTQVPEPEVGTLIFGACTALMRRKRRR